MPLYYLDIETTGLEPLINQIITIQYARIDEKSLEPMTDLMILKIWDIGGEKELLKTFLDASQFFNENFTFTPIGNNIMFDIIFLYSRSVYYGLINTPLWKILHEKPFIDLKPIAVMMNKMDFKGYDWIIRRYGKMKHKGHEIPGLYVDKRYDEIIEYIKDEYECTLKFMKDVLNKMIEVEQVEIKEEKEEEIEKRKQEKKKKKK
jgi:hypothetical protein